jgi:hypothetical protein
MGQKCSQLQQYCQTVSAGAFASPWKINSPNT